MNTETASPPDRVVVLLGAEGCVQLQGVPWLREVSDDSGAWMALGASGQLCMDDLRELATDETGRPYFLVELDPSAPQAARAHAAECVRILKLRLS